MRRARPLLGTIVEIDVATDFTDAESTIDDAFSLIAEIQSLLNFHDPNSELSRLNSSTESEVEAHPLVAKVVELGLSISHESLGAFSMSGGSGSTIAVTGNFICRSPIDKIDLSGIAKGYAVDAAINLLKSRGVRSATVNAGGDLRTYGVQLDVVLRNPCSSSFASQKLALRDAALATSALFEPFGFSRRLIQPTQNSCTQTPYSSGISIVCEHCAIADGLTKTIFLSPQDRFRALQKFSARSFLYLKDKIVDECASLT